MGVLERGVESEVKVQTQVCMEFVVAGNGSYLILEADTDLTKIKKTFSYLNVRNSGKKQTKKFKEITDIDKLSMKIELSSAQKGLYQICLESPKQSTVKILFKDDKVFTPLHLNK